jgi:hypothetical protein
MSNTDPRYHRTRYGTVYVGVRPRRRGRLGLALPRERPEAWGWRPLYRHAQLRQTVYEQGGCKLAAAPGGQGWYAKNRHGVQYHYQASLQQLTPDILADERQAEDGV